MNENPRKIENIVAPRQAAAAAAPETRPPRQKKAPPTKEAYPGYKTKEGEELTDVEEHFAAMHERKEDQKPFEELTEAAKERLFKANEDSADDPSVEAQKRADEFAVEQEPEHKRGTASGGENRGSRGSRTEQAEQKPLEELEKKMKEAADEYAKTYGLARAKRKWFQKILDVNVEKGNEEVIGTRNKYLEARKAYISGAIQDFRERSAAGGGDPQKLDLDMEVKMFTDSLLGDKLGDLATAKNDETLKANRDKGWWSKNVINKYMKVSEWISKRPWYVQVGFYGLLLGAGTASAVYGVPALAAGAFYTGVAARLLRAGAAGKGMHGLTDRGANWYRNWRGKGTQETARDIIDENIIPRERKGSMERRLDDLEKFLVKDNEKLDKRLVRQAGGDKWRRRLGVFTGAMVGSGAIGYLIGGMGIGGKIKEYLLGSHEAKPTGVGGKGGAAIPESGKGGAAVPAEAGKAKLTGYGSETFKHGEFSGDFAEIKEGGSIWRSTREIFLKHPQEYNYNDQDAERLFKSFKGNGNLRRLGMRGIENFSDLTDGQKHTIWAEWKAATAIQDYKVGHGGKITDLVHRGDSVRLDGKGNLFLDNTSKIKMGYLHDVQRPRGGAGVYEPQGRGAAYEPGGKGNVIDTSEFDRRIEEARARGAAADARLREIRGPIADKLAAEASEVANADSIQAHKWMDFVQSKIHGPGTGVDWDEPARDFRKRMMGSLLTSDQPMGPPSNIGEQQQYWNAAKELSRKLGPALDNTESTEEWLQRGLAQKKVSPEDMVRVLKRVVNA